MATRYPAGFRPSIPGLGDAPMRGWCPILLLAVTLSAAAAEPTVPDDFPKLIAPTTDVIVTALAGEPTRRAADKARAAALVLAASAQQNLDGPEGARRATIRDAAVAIAGLVKNKQYPEAVKQARLLPTLPANPAAVKTRVALAAPHLDIDLLMGPFRSVRLGGLALEERLDELATAPGGMIPAAALNDDLRLQAYRIAVLAELTRLQSPDAKSTKAWQAASDAMRKGAVELHAAAQTKDGTAAFRAVEALNSSCKQCHKEFRQ